MHDTLISPGMARELTSLAYFLTAGLAGYYTWRTQPAVPGTLSSHGLYKKSAYILLLIGINKMYNMQLWVWHMMRNLFRTFDLYNYRWTVQIGLVGLLVLAIAAIIYRRRRTNSLRSVDVPVVRALGLIICLISVRTLSFHYIDVFFGLRILGFQLYWLMEWGVIALIALALRRSFNTPLQN